MCYLLPVGNENGVVPMLEGAEVGQEGDSNGNAPDAVKEDEKKEALKKMAARSEWWKHFEKIKVDGVVQKGKCNYCKINIVAHPVINGTSALAKHFRVCKCNPHRNNGDDKLRQSSPVPLQSLLDVW